MLKMFVKREREAEKNNGGDMTAHTEGYSRIKWLCNISQWGRQFYSIFSLWVDGIKITLQVFLGLISQQNFTQMLSSSRVSGTIPTVTFWSFLKQF